MIPAFSEVWQILVEQVFPAECDLQAGLFNPYSKTEPACDRPAAAQIRRENLFAYFESFKTYPDVLMLGEAPGWRGCRFSGAPFTSEAQLADGRLPFAGRPTSRQRRPYGEASATIYWNAILGQSGHDPLCGRVLAWNCLPLHPHLPGNPLSNRRPKPTELAAWQSTLSLILASMQPLRVIAVGRTAAEQLARMSINALEVRHPAHGGAAAFRVGVATALTR